jgi:hypothetical protein
MIFECTLEDSAGDHARKVTVECLGSCGSGGSIIGGSSFIKSETADKLSGAGIRPQFPSAREIDNGEGHSDGDDRPSQGIGLDMTGQPASQRSAD